MKGLFYLLVIYSVPLVSLAAGLVPCSQKLVDGKLVDECGICQVGQLIKGIGDWLALVAGILVVLIIIVAGLILATSVGNVSAKTNARRYIMTAVVGYMILLGAWVLVDTFLKFLIPGSSYGVSNPLIC